MGALALYLAERFAQHRRPSWTIGREQRLLGERLARRLDFDPRFDGNRARRHLARRLAFGEVLLDESPSGTPSRAGTNRALNTCNCASR